MPKQHKSTPVPKLQKTKAISKPKLNKKPHIFTLSKTQT